MELPSFGFYSKWETLSPFFELSERAHDLFDRRAHDNRTKLARPIRHLFLRIAYQAKMTSIATRLNTGWALVMPALALLRVRLEQLIVCSYLIHEEESIGLKPFINHIPISDHLAVKAVLSDADLARQLTGLDASAIEAKAATAQAELTPGFTLIDGHFQRRWTSLDLRSMAIRRDQLAKSKPAIGNHRLEREYLSIYKTACSVVHADCSSLSYRYLDVFPGDSGPVLMARPEWALTVHIISTVRHIGVLRNPPMAGPSDGRIRCPHGSLADR